MFGNQGHVWTSGGFESAGRSRPPASLAPPSHCRGGEIGCWPHRLDAAMDFLATADFLARSSTKWALRLVLSVAFACFCRRLVGGVACAVKMASSALPTSCMARYPVESTGAGWWWGPCNGFVFFFCLWIDVLTCMLLLLLRSCFLPPADRALSTSLGVACATAVEMVPFFPPSLCMILLCPCTVVTEDDVAAASHADSPKTLGLLKHPL